MIKTCIFNSPRSQMRQQSSHAAQSFRINTISARSQLPPTLRTCRARTETAVPSPAASRRLTHGGELALDAARPQLRIARSLVSISTTRHFVCVFASNLTRPIRASHTAHQPRAGNRCRAACTRARSMSILCTAIERDRLAFACATCRESEMRRASAPAARPRGALACAVMAHLPTIRTQQLTVTGADALRTSGVGGHFWSVFGGGRYAHCSAAA